MAHQNVPEKGERPLGAVIVQNGKIIAIGINDAWETRNLTNHTEMKAIREANYSPFERFKPVATLPYVSRRD
ncbi:deaminase [Peribacillus butanolivorans]|uniref:deaminase n=1 Tax=Peribacillus butanolivorans TaxID=421767 RepID=UPI00382CEB0D